MAGQTKFDTAHWHHAGDGLTVFDESKCEHVAERKGRTVHIYDHNCLDEITEALSVGDENPQC